MLGAALDPAEVKKARQEEIEYLYKIRFYTKVPTSQCWKETVMKPISVRWVDIYRGDTKPPNYRSILVAPCNR